MFKVFSRSWEITKLSFRVIGHDREMLLFPLLSGVFSVIFFIAMLFPSIISKLIENSKVDESYTLVMVFLSYLGLAFISTFFSVATVYMTKKRFAGEDSTFFESIKFAFSKFFLIFLWSVVSATVGLILKLVEDAAKKSGGPIKYVLYGIRAIFGMAWAIVSVFVVPAMVYNNVGPIDALRQSASAVRKTWGESLARVYGLGFVQFLFILLGVLVFGGLLYFFRFLDSYVLFVVGGVGVIYLLFVFLVFNVANTVYNTALFEYANTGKIPSGFSSDVIAGAYTDLRVKE